MDEQVEQYAKVCAICGKSYMTNSELVNFCEKCFREQNIDLLVVDAAAKVDPVERLKKFNEKLDEVAQKRNSEAKEYLAKMKRISKKQKWLHFSYAFIVSTYAAFLLWNFFKGDDYTILRYETACHEAPWYVAGDGDYRCEQCDRDVTAEVLFVLQETKGLRENPEGVINNLEPPDPKQEP